MTNKKCLDQTANADMAYCEYCQNDVILSKIWCYQCKGNGSSPSTYLAHNLSACISNCNLDIGW